MVPSDMPPLIALIPFSAMPPLPSPDIATGVAIADWLSDISDIAFEISGSALALDIVLYRPGTLPAHPQSWLPCSYFLDFFIPVPFVLCCSAECSCHVPLIEILRISRARRTYRSLGPYLMTNTLLKPGCCPCNRAHLSECDNSLSKCDTPMIKPLDCARTLAACSQIIIF